MSRGSTMGRMVNRAKGLPVTTKDKYDFALRGLAAASKDAEHANQIARTTLRLLGFQVAEEQPEEVSGEVNESETK